MRAHLPQVRKTIDLLAYMLRQSDPDGLDLYFTKSSRNVKSKKRHTHLLRALDEQIFSGTTDLTIKLNTIIEEYKARSSNQAPKHRFPWLHRSQVIEPPRPLNLYVLTDGLVQPKCDIRSVVQKLVSFIQAHGLPNNHVGIQFIQFGRDADGEEMLGYLDSQLKLEL